MRPVWAIAKLVIKEIFRKKDFYVAFVLMGVILLFAQGMRFYNAKNVSRYLAEIGLALVYIFSIVLCGALAARQFTSEVQNRTGILLLSKPISRGQFVLGKYLGSLLAGLAVFALFFGFFMTVLNWKTEQLDWRVAGQTFYLFALSLAVFCAMVSAFSYSLTVPANVTVSLTVYILISLYGASLRGLSEGFALPARTVCQALYYAFPHFEFFDLRQRLIHGWEGVAPQLLGFLTLYASAYVFLFLLLAYLSFRRRSL